MSESRAIYGSNTGLLSDFSEPLRPALHLVEKNGSDEAGLLLLQFVAAFAHPDYMCNLAMLEPLPIEHKEAALEFFEFCLTSGLSADERAALLRFVEARLAQTPRGAARPR